MRWFDFGFNSWQWIPLIPNIATTVSKHKRGIWICNQEFFLYKLDTNTNTQSDKLWLKLVTLILFLNVIRSLLRCIKATIQLLRLFFFVFLVDELDCSPCSSLGFCVSQFSKLYIVILLDYKPHWISFFFLSCFLKVVVLSIMLSEGLLFGWYWISLYKFFQLGSVPTIYFLSTCMMVEFVLFLNSRYFLNSIYLWLRLAWTISHLSFLNNY